MSCAGALENRPKSTSLQTFGNRGTAIQGAHGLPYRYISCKPQLCAAVFYEVFSCTRHTNATIADGDCIIDIDYVGGVENPTSRRTKK